MKPALIFPFAFIAATAIPSGIWMISHPEGRMMNLSTAALYRTPFQDFLVPGIVLSFLVGGANLLALIFIVKHSAGWFYVALVAGTIMSAFIVAQLTMMNDISWLQFLYLGVGLLIILLADRLHRVSQHGVKQVQKHKQ